jgi:hypothetical protein
MQTQELLSFHIVKRLNPHNLQKDNVFYSIVFNVFVAKKKLELKDKFEIGMHRYGREDSYYSEREYLFLPYLCVEIV